MLTLVHLGLVLAALSTLVVADCDPSLSQPKVYKNCSCNDDVTLPHSADSTPFFKPQIRINPAEINNNGTGWEEWMFFGHNYLPDGSDLAYSYKWALGDPTSANVSHTTFIALAYFPNGTFYREIVHGIFEYEKNEDGGFTYTIGNNSLTWDPLHGIWKTSVNANGYIIESITEVSDADIPFAPNYQSETGQISKDFFSRMDVPRGHTQGFIYFPWGMNVTLDAVGNLKHTWSNEVMADTLSAYVRGSTYLPAVPPLPAATVTWFQAWDNNGNEVDSVQYFVQADGSVKEQDFRLQITDAPELLSIVTTPKPVALPLSFDNTVLTISACDSEVDFENSDKKMTWKANNVRNLVNFIDFAFGSTIYQEVNMTGTLWINGKETEVAGGIGIVEVYHK